MQGIHECDQNAKQLNTGSQYLLPSSQYQTSDLMILIVNLQVGKHTWDKGGTKAPYTFADSTCWPPAGRFSILGMFLISCTVPSGFPGGTQLAHFFPHAG